VQAPASPTVANEWHEFSVTWTATGNRHLMNLGKERNASIANFDGSLLLAGTSRPTLGFRAQAILLNARTATPGGGQALSVRL